MPQGTAWWQEWVEGCHAKGRWKADINDPEVLGLCLCNPVTWISFATKRTLVRLRGVARYFFDLYNDMDVLDEEGVELHDLDDALDRALCEARAMIQASVADKGRIDLRHHIDIRDESGAVIYVMHFEDAVTVQRGAEILTRPSALRSV